MTMRIRGALINGTIQPDGTPTVVEIFPDKVEQVRPGDTVLARVRVVKVEDEILVENIHLGLHRTWIKLDDLVSLLHEDEPVEKVNKFNPQSIDAKVWAKEFMRLYHQAIVEKRDLWIDEGLMFGWFANAIMCGYDNAKRKNKDEPVSEKVGEIEELELSNVPISGRLQADVEYLFIQVSNNIKELADKVNELVKAVNKLAGKE